jgi:outer membrane immunogenic protein
MAFFRRIHARLACAAMTALISACSIVQPAGAADLPRGAPALKAVSAPLPDWTGFYLGLGAGYGMFSAANKQDIAGTPFADNLTGGAKGGFATAVVGFDWQFTSRIVAGVFAEYDFAGGIAGNQFGALPAASTARMALESAWHAGGRIGWLLSPGTFSYFTAGYTAARFKGATLQLAAAPFPTTGTTLPDYDSGGYFIGGGVEWMVTPGWFVRGEYRYAKYGADRVELLAGGAPSGFFNSFETVVQTVRFAVTRKFGWPGAPVYSGAPWGNPSNAAGWTGFYAGAGFGYGLIHNEADQLAASVVVSGNQTSGGKGYIGTVSGGVDTWAGGRLVVGLFADADLSGIEGYRTNAQQLASGKSKQEWAWAIGARVGWLADPTRLFYVTAGFTQAHFKGFEYVSVIVPHAPIGLTSPAHTYDGWFAGGGIETGLFWPGWFLKTEYRYAKYDAETLPLTAGGAPTAFADRNGIAVQTVRSILSYKFGSAGLPITSRH